MTCLVCILQSSFPLIREGGICLGEAIFSKAQRGYVKLYRWKQYNATSTTTYTWNRWNALSTTTYTWNKWNAVSNGLRYIWSKYYVVYEEYRTATTYKRVIESSTGYLDILNGVYIEHEFGMLSYNNTTRYTFDQLTNASLRQSLIGNHASASYSNSGFLDGFDEVTSTRMIALVNKTDLRVKERGSYIETVYDSNANAYPSNGLPSNLGVFDRKYWYVSAGSETVYIKGSTSYGTVSSTNSSAYPTDGKSGSYWYTYANSSTSWSQGSTKYSDVSSTNASAYPDNGRSGSYWYVYSTSSTTWSMGSYIGEITSTDENAYPQNGRSGSYWYVYDGTV